jgi:hypothetical protein
MSLPEFWGLPDGKESLLSGEGNKAAAWMSFLQELHRSKLALAE